MRTRQPTGDTDARLLQAACNVFAEKGFRQATIAEIRRKARANIAAVNYHFGSKQALYKEAWRHAHRAALAAVMIGGLGCIAASAVFASRLPRLGRLVHPAYIRLGLAPVADGEGGAAPPGTVCQRP